MLGGEGGRAAGRERHPQPRSSQAATSVPAVALAERVLAEGDPLLRDLDAQSLAWRGKPPKSPTTRR